MLLLHINMGACMLIGKTEFSKEEGKGMICIN